MEEFFYEGLVWSGLVWSGLVWSGQFFFLFFFWSGPLKVLLDSKVRGDLENICVKQPTKKPTERKTRQI